MDTTYNFQIKQGGVFLVYVNSGSKLLKTFTNPEQILKWASTNNVNGRRFDEMYNRFANMDRKVQVVSGMSVKNKTIEKGTILSNPNGSGETYTVGKRGRPARWVRELLGDADDVLELDTKVAE
jgi:hypothetical protein